VSGLQILNFSNEDRLKSMVKQIFEENNYTMHALKMMNKRALNVVYREELRLDDPYNVF